MRKLRTRKQRRAYAREMGMSEGELNARKHNFLEKSADKMRQNPTGAEKILLDLFNEVLPRHRITFAFQHVLAGKIVDFYLPKQRLIVEVDGGYHYFKKGQQARDRARQGEITRKHRNIIRFDNEYVENFPRETIAAILAKCGPQFEIRD